MPYVAPTRRTPRTNEVPDWLSLFPAEKPEPAGEFERPPAEDPFELFPPERRLIEEPALLATRQLPPVPRPALRIVVEPIDMGWRLPEIHLSPNAKAMMATGVAVILFTLFVRSRPPVVPDIVHPPAIDVAAPATQTASAPGAPASVIQVASRGGATVATPPAPTRTTPSETTSPATTPLRAATSAQGNAPVGRSNGAANGAANGATKPQPFLPPTPATTIPALTTSLVSAVLPPTPAVEPPRVAARTPATVPPPTPPATPDAEPEPPAAPPAPRPTEEAAIESVLGGYRSAYSALDIRDVQRVWPQVDRRALERTFADLEEQSLQFDGCRIDITGRDARASCTGSARLVAKGAARPKLESRRWEFLLSKIGTDWKILSAQARR